MPRKLDSSPRAARSKRAASRKGARSPGGGVSAGATSAPAAKNAVPILIIDDNDDFRETLCCLIQEKGYLAKAVANGLEASRLLAAESFALVLTDMFMPEKDGFQVIRDVHKTYPELPIVAMSGGGIVRRGEHLKVARFFGAKAILRKPFTERQLFSTIRSLVG
jgi:CheY-like chemotaxis protein